MAYYKKESHIVYDIKYHFIWITAVYNFLIFTPNISHKAIYDE